ncbi:MAG TPA: hypothetical protein VGR01_14770 [Burkholderiales bacterium]|jgi:hypothetical protein|nr:hypothetical protein [Burkholderiales bacterium]
MHKLLAGVAVLGLWLGCLAQIQGQEMTEMYIPIGQSPGVSGRSSLVGAIESVNVQNQTLAVSGPSGIQAIVLTDRTRIWLDRTLARLPNQIGTLANLQKGLHVEVKLRDADQKRVAEWVKVQVTESGAPARKP